MAPTPAPTPAATATPAAGTAPTARDLASVLTAEERRDFATGKRSIKDIIASRGPAKPAPASAPAPAAPVSEPTPTPEQPAAQSTTEPTPGAAAAANPDVPEQPGAQPGETPDRFRFKAPEDQAIALLAKSKGIPLAEAVDLFRGTNKPPAAAVPAVPAPAEDQALKQYDTDIAKLDADIKKLSEDRKKAREDVDNEKADSLSDQIAGLTADHRMLVNERAGHLRNREAAAVQSIEQQTVASRDRLLADYPELQAEGSLHRLALDAYVSRALADPARASEFADPTWPEKLGAEFVSKHGLKRKSAGAAPSPAATSAPPGSPPAGRAAPTPTPAPSLRPKPQQVPGAKLMTSADGATPSAAAPTPADLQRDLARMSPAQRRALVTHRR